MYPDKDFRLPACAQSPGHQPELRETLIYELLDAHDDTARLVAEGASSDEWDRHLGYLRDLQRVGREILAREAGPR